MKIITNDYGCGTSSAFLDYKLEDVVVCSEENHAHVFDIQGEDLFFVGHEFLMYLWDNEKYREHWKNYPHAKIIWCFEKVDCVIPQWQQKSHYSLGLCQTFTDKFVASDEQDCRKYGLTWLPQWASCRFYENRNQIPLESRVVFSGQAGVPGYAQRDDLLKRLSPNIDLCYISNHKRTKSWDDYISNFLNHSKILAPLGNLKAFNTRTFEALTSGRLLLQQVDEEFPWHMKLLEKYPNVRFFQTHEELLELLKSQEIQNFVPVDPTQAFEENTVFARFKMLGLEVK